MLGMGYAMMGTAVATGENAAVEAARQAISCPLFDDTKIAGAHSILMSITGSSRLGFHEVSEACAIVREAAECDDTQINFGVIMNESMGESVKITVIATGFHGAIPMMERRSDLAIPVVRMQAPPPAPETMPEIQAAPAEAEPPQQELNGEPMLDLEDLDTPAYLRQGRLLN
jgi:cell division protein FtsZ